MKTKAALFDSSVDDLAILAEEGARASSRAEPRFIEPMKGTLRRAQSKRHHLVFGRRGSGKSSLLYKSADTLRDAGFAVAFIEQGVKQGVSPRARGQSSDLSKT